MEKVFTGAFDGGGNVIRGLRIDRAGFHNGLISYTSGSIVNVGLDDVYVSGATDGDQGFGSGALVGGLNGGGIVSESWARGEVIGSGSAGGLIGALGSSTAGSAAASASWFAGRATSRLGNFSLASGLLGQITGGNSAVADSWAVSELAVVKGNEDAHENRGGIIKAVR